MSHRLLVVDDDPLFRESLIETLEDDGYEVAEFGAGQPALDYLTSGGAADLVVLDWHMPGMNGIQLLRAMRDAGVGVPVVFLTVLSDQIYEEAALDHGAVDFVEKSRSVGILKRRIALSLQRSAAAAAGEAGETGQQRSSDAGTETRGRLTINREVARAYWQGSEVPLTLNEFKLVDLLVGKAGRDVRYRELYDQVHGSGFVAGFGEDGFRSNVRTLIKRIRQKFRTLDPDFEAIENYPGFGYRWRDDAIQD